MQQNNDKEIVLSTSDKAARFVENISGWVSRHGRFYGKDERLARYDGSTHRPCESCGKPTEKSYLKCYSCRDRAHKERHAKRTVEEWDEKGLLYSFYADEYFRSWDEVDDYALENDVELSAMQLVICDPVYLSKIDSDYWCDELSEDGELPAAVQEALNDLNMAIQEAGPVSWTPGKKAAAIVRQKA